MRRPPFAIALAVLASLAATPAARADEAACGTFKWSIAAERQLLAAPGLAVETSGGTLAAPGQGVAMTLAPEGGVSYPVKPARPPKVNPSYGSTVNLGGVSKAQTLQVTLSDEAWVDLVQNGKVIRSTGFSGKAGCPGVRKSVRFPVGPGPVVIEVSNAASPALKLAVVPVD